MVLMPVESRKLNPSYKRVINRHINVLKKRYKRTDLVIWYLVELIIDKNIKDKWDPAKGAWSTYVVMRLYYAILDQHDKIHTQEENRYAEYLKYGDDFFEYHANDFIEKEPDFEGNQEEVLNKEELEIIVKEYFGEELIDNLKRGFTVKETAVIMGKRYEAIKKYIHRKRKGFLNYLIRRGFNVEDLPESISERLKGGENG